MSLRFGFSHAGILDEILPNIFNQNYSINKAILTPDEYWMLEAYKEAMKGIGFASPNPAVGCVIVKNGAEISRGYTQEYGKEHAEKNAIDKIIDKDILKDSTLYVTLEPCCHHGKQPPCTELFIKYNIKKCVIGMIDPNPKVYGKGIELLSLNGIEVKYGVLEN